MTLPDTEPSAHFDRLTALDSAFLALETGSSYMHIALTGIFDKVRARGAGGRVDMDRMRRYTTSVLAGVPKFRQRLLRIPFVRHPVLVDDEAFDLDAHLRYIELPSPGDDSELKDLVSRIYSEPLDRSRPLWQQWVIDDLEGERFAVVIKVHHCLLDGVAGIAVLAAMLRATPDDSVEPPSKWTPRPAPSGRDLVKADFAHRVEQSASLWRELRQGSGAVRSPRSLVAGAASIVRAAVSPCSRTRINPPSVGPLRQFDWFSLDLDDIKTIRRAAGVTINDVVLSIVAGGFRRYLSKHGEPVGRLTFRAMVPMSLHVDRETDLRNRVSLMLARLPLDEHDPAERLRRVAAAMEEAKHAGQGGALGFGERLADLTAHGTLSLGAKAVIRMRPFNVIVTNIPGPQFPLYLLGDRLIAAYPLVPLYYNQAVGIALVSYDGRIYFGINADPGRVDDLSYLVACFLESFRELARAVAMGARPQANGQ